VVDSDAETVVVFSQPNHVRVVGKTDLLDASALLPGFSCRIAEIFE
jgi:Uma2 family endonuclease